MMKLKLRKLQLDDAERMLEWMLDPNIYSKMQYDHNRINLDTCRLFIKNSWNDKLNLHWAIVDSNNDYMGTISLKNIDYKNKNAEFGVAMHPVYMRRGVATYALCEVAEKAFFELELNKIYLYVRCDNERAVLFYKKNHMEYEGCAKEHLFVDGEYKDVLWFSLRKGNYSEWREILDSRMRGEKKR